MKLPQTYWGLRFSADAMDCAMPMAFDSHSGCSFNCLYCNPEDTQILMGDISWKFIKDVKVGDEIVGVTKKSGRYELAVGIVEELMQREAEVYELETEEGSVKMTADHPFLSRNSNAGVWSSIRSLMMGGRSWIGKYRIIRKPFVLTNHPDIDDNYMIGYLYGIIKGDANFDIYESKHQEGQLLYRFRLAMKDQEPLDRTREYLEHFGVSVNERKFSENMNSIYSYSEKEFDKIDSLLKVVNDDSWRKGFLAGIFDAEGSYTNSTIRIRNQDEDLIDLVEDSLERFGFDYAVEMYNVEKGVWVVTLRGDTAEKGRFLMLCSPSIERKKRGFIGAKRIRRVSILGFKSLGRMPVYNMQTSIHTFIANGFVVHNCFSNSLMRAPSRFTAKREQLKKLKVSQTEWSINYLKDFLDGQLHNTWTDAMYPLMKEGQPIQWGALGEPFDLAEAETGWGLEAIELIGRAKQPVRVSTKGAETLLNNDNYIQLLSKYHNYFWFNFSIIHPEDEVLSKIDIGAPTASRRFEAMKALSEVGVKTGLRYRPIIPKLASKKLNGEPAWKVMIDKAVESGAVSISYEIIFLNQLANPSQRNLYRLLSEAIEMSNFPQYWKSQSIPSQACLRANRKLNHKLMTDIRDYAREQGLNIGISDPMLKEMSDSPCCCGIPSDNKYFGNFSRKCMTTCVVEGRKAFENSGDNLQFSYNDWAPDWAKKIPLRLMCALGDAEKHKQYENTTWYDKMRNLWNNPQHFRSPYYYFEGILHPVGLDEFGDVIYEYRDWETQVYKKPVKITDFVGG